MLELLKFRVLERLLIGAWIKKSELTQTPLRHVKAKERELVLYVLVKEGLIEEVRSRRVGGPGAPYLEYRITTDGINAHLEMSANYSDGVSRETTHRVVTG
jgi:hypothetical protein